ncbi:response regulator transcription factor [Bacillus infantis]|uniref:response regulator transcription factor n=1 Tax=Bacillus infantis TaxID=324767 RepID=UPI003CED5303
MSEVLIVDNDKQSRTHLRSIIEESEYSFLSIYEASTAQRGLILLKQNKPNCVIMDLSLPDMEGVKFGYTALQLYPGLPIIIVTQLKMFELVQESINSGFSAYLLKPLTKTEIIEVFNRVLTPELSKRVNGVLKKDEIFSDPGNPIDSAIKYIQDNYHASLTLKSIADSVYLSPSHFSRMFKEQLGMTFVEYLAFIRIQKAKSLLRLTSFSVEVIANNTGFSTAGYFSTTFKKVVGVTPSEYRDRFSWEKDSYFSTL